MGLVVGLSSLVVGLWSLAKTKSAFEVGFF